jgi:hypothetical protein
VGDDPCIPIENSVSGGSSNANNYFITTIGKPSLVILVVTVGLSLGLAVGAIVVSTLQTNIANQRAAEAVSSSEVLRIYVDELTQEMVKAGIKVPPVKKE